MTQENKNINLDDSPNSVFAPIDNGQGGSISVGSGNTTTIITIQQGIPNDSTEKNKQSNVEKFDIKTYREKVVSEFNGWQNRFVHLKGKEEFEEILLFAEEAEWDIEAEDKKAKEKRQDTIQNLRNELIKEGCYKMVIAGEAGMGKTTTLKYLALKDALDQNKNIPIYIELKLHVSELSIEDYIAKKYGMEKNYFVQLLNEGKVNLYLDGLNEISPHLKINTFYNIKDILKKYPKVFVLMSSRPRDYRNDFEKAPLFILQKLNPDQIREFLYKNTDKEDARNKILNKIKDNNWERLLGTPLILSMLLQLVIKEEEIPNDEHKIIIQFIKYLYKREKDKDTNFDSDYFHLIICHFAFRGIEIKGNTNSGMKLVEVENIFKEYDKNMSKRDLLYFLKKAIELNLIVDDEGIYSFAHQAYQDTLAGNRFNIIFA